MHIGMFAKCYFNMTNENGIQQNLENCFLSTCVLCVNETHIDGFPAVTAC